MRGVLSLRFDELSVRSWRCGKDSVWSINILVLFNVLEWWEGYVFLLKGVMPMRSAQPGVLNKRRIHRPVNNVTQPQHTSFGVARGKGCRGGETAFGNYECFPSPAVSLTLPKRKNIFQKKIFRKKNPKDISLQSQ